jgi:hypothetical protein
VGVAAEEVSGRGARARRRKRSSGARATAEEVAGGGAVAAIAGGGAALQVNKWRRKPLSDKAKWAPHPSLAPLVGQVSRVGAGGRDRCDPPG